MALPQIDEVRQEFDPNVISSSRMQALTQCGTAFDMRYIQSLREEKSGSSSLFGLVVHKTLEEWGLDRSQPILPLIRGAWLSVAQGDPICEFLQAYGPLSTEAIKEKYRITEERAAHGIETKAVGMTKAWKESGVAREIAHLTRSWSRKLQDSRWRFTDYDPLPGLYDESLPLMRRYQETWSHLPNVLKSEFKFDIPWRSFRLIGVIDAVEILNDRDSCEVLGLGITDYKTYAKEPAELKDWRQGCFYDVAIRELLLGGELELEDEVYEGVMSGALPLFVGFDYVRLGYRDYLKIENPDRERLERECCIYRDIVTQRLFLPAEKGRNPDYCGYPSRCCLRSCEAAGGKATRVEVNV